MNQAEAGPDAPITPDTPVTVETVKTDARIAAYITRADEFIGAIGFTEHGFRHADLVAHIAANIMRRLGYSDRDAELAAVAAYLHDIGNVVGRDIHGLASALIAESCLRDLGMPADEIAVVMNAIGTHEEEESDSVMSPVGAAVVLADKSDVHRTRVRNPDPAAFDIHDRVNFAATRSFLRVDEVRRLIELEISIDTSISQVMEYFEIFLSRMVRCRGAAEFLGCKFGLVVNNTRLL